MKWFNLPKLIFYTVLIVIALGGSFCFGLYHAAGNTRIYKKITLLTGRIIESFELVAAESATIAKIHPDHFVQPARYKGEGVTINRVDPNNDDLIFMSGFFEEGNQLRLIERDGTVVAKWPVNFYDIFDDNTHIKKKPETNWNIDTHGALALPDGSVVFNFEYCGLVRLDRYGNVIWKLERETHHSVELSEKGGFWVPCRRHHPKGKKSPFPPFYTPFCEDTILYISQDGKILKEISVPGLFMQNNLETLLTVTGHDIILNKKWDQEILHLNKVGELSSDMAKDFPMFEAGDLALSIRESNLVMVIDPDTQKVKWWRIGPWIRQHDPEFKKGGLISVFNNNCYGTALDPNFLERSPLSAPRVSNILELNPTTDKFNVVYGEKSEQKMLSIIRGKHELSHADGLLITEFEGGRVFETDKKGRIIWEYVNRYDEDEVAEITEARIYQKDYFKDTDWKRHKEDMNFDKEAPT
jgi:hypothetical protein